MTTEYGLISTGFLPKTLTVIREDLNTALRSAFGVSVDLGDRSAFGQCVGIFAEVFALLWELSEAVNNSQDPDAATGASLDALSALTGTFRAPATHSSVILTLTGTPATSVTAGSEVSTTSTALHFETSTTETITLLDTAGAGATAYVVGDRVTLAGLCFECITAGTSDGTGGGLGPRTAEEDITDGTVHWTYLGEGTGAVDVVATAVDTGAIVAVERDLTTIETAIDGWTSSINLEDAALGRALATDSELRLLRQIELAGAGRSTVDSIIAALYGLSDTITANVFVNNSDVTDGDGLPPHSIEALVQGILEDSDSDQLVFDTLLENVAAGIVTYGGETGAAEDSQGTSHVIKFSRPTGVPIYVDISVIVDADLYPEDGDDQVKDAIVAFGNSQPVGKNAVASGISAQAFIIPGVLDVTLCYIDDVPSPVTTTTIQIALREIATFDVDDIDVTSTPGTP